MIRLGGLGSLVPIVAIVMGVGVAFWTLYLDHQRRRLQYEERLVVAALFPGIGGLARIAGFVAPIVLFLGVGNLAYYFVARSRAPGR